MKRSTFVIAAALLAVGLVAAAPTPASAHLHDRFGDVDLSIGWASEPAFAGEPNAVQVILTEAAESSADHTHAEGEASTRAVDTRQVNLTVEILFGEQDATEKMAAQPLTPYRFGEPGEWRSEAVVPTRPGTYTFHIEGTIKGRAFDRSYTSGEKGAIEGTEYNDVQEVAAVSFPEKDPSSGELAAAVQQSRRAALAAADRASDEAKAARLFGIIGIAVGVIGLAVGLRPRRGRAGA